MYTFLPTAAQTLSDTISTYIHINNSIYIYNNPKTDTELNINKQLYLYLCPSGLSRGKLT